VWRYFAVSTAIVAAVLAAILALPERPRTPASGAHYASSRNTPGPGQRDTFASEGAPVSGNAPWALSALPECFRQRSSTTGPPAFARAKIPRAARRIAPGATLHVADCTLTVLARTVLVTRGENRLVVPPEASVYAAGDALILDRRDGPWEDVRIYALPSGAAPAFVGGVAPKP
jgi:hypothetical protein